MIQKCSSKMTRRDGIIINVCGRVCVFVHAPYKFDVIPNTNGNLFEQFTPFLPEISVCACCLYPCVCVRAEAAECAEYYTHMITRWTNVLGQYSVCECVWVRPVRRACASFWSHWIRNRILASIHTHTCAHTGSTSFADLLVVSRRVCQVVVSVVVVDVCLS